MLIIDGYNLLHQLPSLKGKGIDRAREELIRKLEIKRKSFDGILIVFDGERGNLGRNLSEEKIKVIFSGELSADDYIKRIVKNSKTPQKITVVTDDREIKDFVKLYGTHLLSTKKMGDILYPEKPVITEIYEKPSPSSEKGKRINEELRRIWKIHPK